MSAKTIVILGGGIGGMTAANEFRRLLSSENRIILVERNPKYFFPPSFLWIMTGRRRADQIQRDLKQLLLPGIELELAEIVAIDVNQSQVETSTRRLSYDYLIIAMGAEYAAETIPGLSENAHTYYTSEGAQKLFETLKGFSGGRVALVVGALPYKCPAAPHEGAMLIVDFLDRRKLDKESEVHLFTPEPQPMPVGGPALGELVLHMLNRNRVIFHPLHKLTGVDGVSRQIHFDGRDTFQYDLLVAIPPHRGSQVVKEAGLANEAGWIPVDPFSLQTKFHNISALGDITTSSIPGRWKADAPLMLPKAGVFAHGQARTVAQRIASEITGNGKKADFSGIGYCMLEAGDNRAGIAYGNFYAEPAPQIELRNTAMTWHLGKVIFEKYWLSPPGFRRNMLQLLMNLGGSVLGVQIKT